MSMGGLMRIAVVAAMSSAMSLAATWSGPLVDANCYAAELRNVGPFNTEPWANTDLGSEIHFCSPTHKTKSFGIVRDYLHWLKFDATGNAKAAALVQNVRKRHVLQVAVTGQEVRKRLQVDSIAPLVQSQR